MYYIQVRYLGRRCRTVHTYIAGKAIAGEWSLLERSILIRRGRRETEAMIFESQEDEGSANTEPFFSGCQNIFSSPRGEDMPLPFSTNNKKSSRHDAFLPVHEKNPSAVASNFDCVSVWIDFSDFFLTFVAIE